MQEQDDIVADDKLFFRIIYLEKVRIINCCKRLDFLRICII